MGSGVGYSAVLDMQLDSSGALVGIHCGDNTVKGSPNYPDEKWDRLAKNRASRGGSMELRPQLGFEYGARGGVSCPGQCVSAEVPPSAIQDVFLSCWPLLQEVIAVSPLGLL
jgi:hypothetical protein